MSEKLLVDVVGWIGSLEVVTAYLLISTHKVNSRSARYQLLNFTGAIFLIVNTIYYGAYPSTFINVVWVGIALVALIGIFARR